jgi:hypothetical protein
MARVWSDPLIVRTSVPVPAECIDHLFDLGQVDIGGSSCRSAIALPVAPEVEAPA